MSKFFEEFNKRNSEVEKELYKLAKKSWKSFVDDFFSKNKDIEKLVSRYEYEYNDEGGTDEILLLQAVVHYPQGEYEYINIEDVEFEDVDWWEIISSDALKKIVLSDEIKNPYFEKPEVNNEEEG